jgi:hypothetical protein
MLAQNAEAEVSTCSTRTGSPLQSYEVASECSKNHALGELTLVAYKYKSIHAQTFDLLNEQDKFKSAVGPESASIGPQQYLH